MKLFIAEKPEIAKILSNNIEGAFKRYDGFFKSNDTVITWAYGHLLELYMPEDYNEDFKIWKNENLPFYFDEFKYKAKAKSNQQLKVILNLLKTADEVIHCGDADEEGQILIDEILMYAKYKKSVKRLLLHDLTNKGVKKSLENIKNNEDFYALSQSGFARSQADWLVGINLTRAYTLAAQSGGHKGVLSVGRVQTPILAMIVAREKEHFEHKKQIYYTLESTFQLSDTNTLTAKLATEDKILDKSIIEDISKKCKDKSFNLYVTNTNKSTAAPLPYNLLNLQIDCAKKYNYKADKTLEITQSLREKHKLITYNRSDCEYLPLNIHKESSSILQAVKNNLNDLEMLVDCSDINIVSRAFDDSKITAHFAIIPTQNNVNINSLSEEEKKVYELIAKRFVLQFYQDKEYINTKLDFVLDEYTFSTSFNTITNLGFTAFLDKDDNDEKLELEHTSDFDCINLKNQEALYVSDNIKEQSTQAKPLYTTSTLLKDLAQASKYVKDERIKSLLKEKDKDKASENGGIGTPATRSEHIKKLFERGYILEDKKKIISSDLGKKLIAFSPKILTTPEMTALWFLKQKQILNNEIDKNDFLKSVLEDIKKDIYDLKNNEGIVNISSNICKDYPCPVCNKGYLQKRTSKKGNAFWGCSCWRSGCNAMFYDNKGKPNI